MKIRPPYRCSCAQGRARGRWAQQLAAAPADRPRSGRLSPLYNSFIQYTVVPPPCRPDTTGRLVVHTKAADGCARPEPPAPPREPRHDTDTHAPTAQNGIGRLALHCRSAGDATRPPACPPARDKDRGGAAACLVPARGHLACSRGGALATSLVIVLQSHLVPNRTHTHTHTHTHTPPIPPPPENRRGLRIEFSYVREQGGGAARDPPPSRSPRAPGSCDCCSQAPPAAAAASKAAAAAAAAAPRAPARCWRTAGRPWG